MSEQVRTLDPRHRAPRPWRVGLNGAIVCDCPPDCKEDKGPEGTEAFYGGHFVCESVGGELAVFIVLAANAHADLLAALETAPEPRVWMHPTASYLDTMLAVREWAASYFEWYRSVRAAALAKTRP